MKSYVFLLFFALALFRTVDGSCSSLPSSACAVLYTDESCGGSSFAVADNALYFGDSDNTLEDVELRAWLRQNDVESISVAAGCTLVGHELENGVGRGISISAGDSAAYHIANLEDYEHILDEDIKSVECRCGEGQSTREVTAVVEQPAGETRRRRSQTQCPAVPKDVCAVIYSEESCRGTSNYFNVAGVDQMRSMREWLRRNDAESVSVAAGCTLVGYEGHRKYENGRGRGISISADSSADHHVEDLDFYEHILDEDIKSVDCRCGEGPSIREVAAIVGRPLEVDGEECPAVPKDVCAVIYSEESCRGTSSYFNVAGVDQMRSMREWLKQNDVESVSVAAGCTLVGYEGHRKYENGRGRGISISADSSADHHVEDLDFYEHILDEDIKSVDCRCGEGPSIKEVAAIVGRPLEVDGEECRLVPKGVCAVLYSEDSCNGRTLNVFNDSSLVAQTRDWLRRNDVDSLSVAAGCILVGHEAENGKGRGISISADTSGDHHVADLEAFQHIYDEDIRSVDCACHGGSKQDVSAVGEPDCPAVPEGACAVVFSEEGCQGQKREVAVGSEVVGEEPESVSVAAGCTFTGYEAGYSVTVEGGTNGKHVEDLEMFFKLHGAVRDLESFQCECN